VEILRNFLGNLSSGVIRLLVTVGILVAVYLLIVRPILDKTGEITKETNESIQKSFNRGFGNNGPGLEDINKTLKEVNKTVEREIEHSLHVAKVHGVGSPKRLVKCIQRAHADVQKIDRCTARF
jgi:predicted PurR-regulated permease PerM